MKSAIEKILQEHEPLIKKGQASKWQQIITELPKIKRDSLILNQDAVSVISDEQLSLTDQEQLKKSLEGLKPWRKGPFHFFGIDIDTEWRSNLKWDRIKDVLPDLNNKYVLDVGCGSSYYMWRCLDLNPDLILGVDPSLIYYFQYLAFQQYAQESRVHFLPIPLEDLPSGEGFQFDLILCMGILYHRRSPIDFLKSLKTYLNPGGYIILEGLYIAGEDEIALCPYERYQKMKNVYFIPTLSCLENWLKQAGFNRFEQVSLSKTKISEQRKTEWLDRESLEDFLDPKNDDLTIEGYPAPRRFVYKILT